MSWCEVTFLPAGKTARVRAGARVMDGAEGLVNLRHVCGGNGQCTTCRVQVREGKQHLSPLNEKESKRLPDERLQADWRLACQARVHGPVTVRIPTLVEQLQEVQREDG